MPAFLMTTETAATIAGDTLYFRVEEQKISYKVLTFKVPPGVSIEETAAALKKELRDPYAWVVTGEVICGATLVEPEDGTFVPDLDGAPVVEVVAVVRTDTDGEDIEGES
jgi:hypothetical protein